MKISFVIPAFNEEHYLAACLESVIREKKHARCDIEIIAVNNASTDRTREVILSYPEVVLVDEPHKGLTHARQAGFNKATGELIAHLDADCLLPEGWTDVVVKRFSGRPSLVALSGPVVYYDLSLWSNLGIRFYYYVGYVSYVINRFILRIGSLLQGGNLVVRRSALEKIGGYNTSIAFYGEDIELAKRLRQLGPVVFSFKLVVGSSGRRIESEGILTMMVKYIANYISTIFFKKPYNNTYLDIRAEKGTVISHSTNLKTFNRIVLAIWTAMCLIGFGFAQRMPGSKVLVAQAKTFSHHHSVSGIRPVFRQGMEKTYDAFNRFTKDSNSDIF